MSLDGIVTKSLVEELNNKILGGRVGKIFQPENDEIILNIYSNGENYKLLLSANSSTPRIHFTNIQKSNPQEPPIFTMVLRKHLSGGIVLNIEQYNMDRIIFMDISALNELGVPTKKRLIIEIMGKHSNIILIDMDNNKIIDSINKVSIDMSRVRQILPGLEYKLPPSQDKLNPLEINQDIFINKFKESSQGQQVFKFFYNSFIGISPLISRELCYRENIDIKKTISSINEEELNLLYKSFSELVENLKNNNYNPTLVTRDIGGYEAFYALDLKQYNLEDKIYKDSISDVLDIYYSQNDRINRVTQKANNMKKSVQVYLERAKNKLSKQKEELLASKDRDKYKVYADLISANFHNIKEKGLSSVMLQNFYSENMEEIEVPLDYKYDANRNAQRYYKKYSRLKNAEQLVSKQIPETEHEIEYLENIIVSIENATEVLDLDDIREELIAENYIKGRRDKKNKKLKTKPYHYISTEGYNIYVGKNNRQNDELTMKFANKDDLWLHVQNMPGSHVIIRNDRNIITEKVIEEAAILAAYYSKAKLSNNVPIDYTERKNVKKPSGSKAGMVIYDNFNTVFATPDIKFINNLEKID